MYMLPPQFASANKAGVETLVTLANAVFAGAERLAALNLNAARTLLEDSAANTRAVLAVKDMQRLVSLPTSLAQPGLDKATVYSRSVYQIASETQEVLSEVVHGQVSELKQSVGLALDKAIESAPAGSAAAVNTMRSVLSAANLTYDNMSKAVRLGRELAEANLAATAATAVKAGRKAS